MFKSYVRREVAPTADSVCFRNPITLQQDLEEVMIDHIKNKKWYRDHSAFVTYLYVGDVYIGRIKYGTVTNEHVSRVECVSFKIFNACADNTRECMKAVEAICGNGSAFFTIEEMEGVVERVSAIASVWLGQFDLSEVNIRHPSVTNDGYVTVPGIVVKTGSDDHVTQFVKRAKEAVVNRTPLEFSIIGGVGAEWVNHLVKLDGNGAGGGYIYRNVTTCSSDGKILVLRHLVFSWYVYPAFFVDGERTKDILNKILNGEHIYSVMKIFPSPGDVPDYGSIAGDVN